MLAEACDPVGGQQAENLRGRQGMPGGKVVRGERGALYRRLPSRVEARVVLAMAME